MFLFLPALFLLAACETQKKMPPRPPAIDTGRMDVNSVQTQFLLHPVEDKVQGEKNTTYFLYDFQNRYLGFVDDQETFPKFQSFLPEYIDASKPNTMGRVAGMRVVIADPFSNFTTAVKKKIANEQGIKFESINSYQIGKGFSVYTVNDTSAAQTQEVKQKLLNGYITLRSMLKGENVSLPPRRLNPPRIPVAGAQGMLTMHPIRIVARGRDDIQQFLFLDEKNKTIFMSKDENLYLKFADALTTDMLANNAVLLNGPNINPLVYFDSQAIRQMTNDLGLEIDGGIDSARRDINKYKIAKISNASIVINVANVISWLDAAINKISPTTALPLNNNNVLQNQTAPPAAKPPYAWRNNSPSPSTVTRPGTQPPPSNGTRKPGTPPASNDRKVY